MPEWPSCSPSLPPSMPHCLVDAMFIFLLGMFHIMVLVSFLRLDFVIHLCCRLGHLIPWACSQFMSFLTSSAACWSQAPLCPFLIARVLKSSLSSLSLTLCATLLVSFCEDGNEFSQLSSISLLTPPVTLQIFQTNKSNPNTMTLFFSSYKPPFSPSNCQTFWRHTLAQVLRLLGLWSKQFNFFNEIVTQNCQLFW